MFYTDTICAYLLTALNNYTSAYNLHTHNTAYPLFALSYRHTYMRLHAYGPR